MTLYSTLVDKKGKKKKKETERNCGSPLSDVVVKSRSLVVQLRGQLSRKNEKMIVSGRTNRTTREVRFEKDVTFERVEVKELENMDVLSKAIRPAKLNASGIGPNSG